MKNFKIIPWMLCLALAACGRPVTNTGNDLSETDTTDTATPAKDCLLVLLLLGWCLCLAAWCCCFGWWVGLGASRCVRVVRVAEAQLSLEADEGRLASPRSGGSARAKGYCAP